MTRKLPGLLIVCICLAGCTPKADRDAFLAAAEKGDIATLGRELKAGVEVDARNEKNETALHLAIAGGHSEVATLLLEQGANVEAAEKNEWRPIHLAAMEGDVAVMERLIELKANVAARGPGGTTAMHQAAMFDHPEAIRILHKSGIDPDVKDDSGWRPLHMAARGCADAVKCLLELGAEPDAEGPKRKRPLVKACANGAIGIARMLIEAGADPGALDELGQSPGSVAKKYQYKVLVGYLEGKPLPAEYQSYNAVEFSASAYQQYAQEAKSIAR